MHKENFITLSPEVRRIWSKTPSDMKKVILRSRTGNCNNGTNNHSKNIYNTVNPPHYPPSKFTTAHLHEILTEIIS